MATEQHHHRQKDRIPRALREQVWLRTAGRKFEIKCPVRWCNNCINVFDFHVGHNKPEAAGGTVHIDNLIAICARCNLSMGSTFTIDLWQLLVITKEPTRRRRWLWQWQWPWICGNTKQVIPWTEPA